MLLLFFRRCLLIFGVLVGIIIVVVTVSVMIAVADAFTVTDSATINDLNEDYNTIRVSMKIKCSFSVCLTNISSFVLKIPLYSLTSILYTRTIDPEF